MLGHTPYNYQDVIYRTHVKTKSRYCNDFDGCKEKAAFTLQKIFNLFAVTGVSVQQFIRIGSDEILKLKAGCHAGT